MLKLNGGLGTSMGMTPGQVADRGEGGALVPRRDRAPGPAPARAARGARPAAADEQLRHARRHAGRARALPRARGRRPAARLPAGQGAEAARGQPRAGRVARRPGARVGAARARRRVHVAGRRRGCWIELLERGYRYLFLSNSDNLGAVLDPRILDWFAREGLPFLSESTDRTESDRKGGHLARRRVGRRPGAARDGADAGRGPRGVRGRRAAPLLQLQQHLGGPARAASGRWPSAAACSGCR